MKSAVSEEFKKAFPGTSLDIKNPPNQDKISSLFEKQIRVSVSYDARPMDNAVPIENVGHGLQRHFILSAINALSRKFEEIQKHKKDFDVGVLLIEEPELFLHPSKLRDLQSLLYQIAETGSFQIIATTHSPILVDLSKPHQSLARVKFDNALGSSILQVRSNLFDENERDRLSMINRFSPYVAEAFFVDECVLVEGDTEATVFRELFYQLRETASETQRDIHIINCVGKHTIPLIQKILLHFQLPYYVIHDIDSEYNSDGSKNSAWSANGKIEEELEAARIAGILVAKYTFDPNFEAQHDYKPSKADGKPYSALKIVREWDAHKDDRPACNYARRILLSPKG
jgi:predicted ATP-dependent endonuclease of OLD family